MKNKDFIIEAFAAFKENNFAKCNRFLTRLKNNFSLNDDEFTFSLVAELTQPNKKLGDKLHKENKLELIGDDAYIASKSWLKEELTIKINVVSKNGRLITVDDDADDGFSYTKYDRATYRFDDEAFISGMGDSYKILRPEIEKWLNQEFGSLSKQDRDDIDLFYKSNF